MRAGHEHHRPIAAREQSRAVSFWSRLLADDKTLEFYKTNAAAYVEAPSDRPRPRLLAFIAALPPGARVLELGAGSGRDAAEMLRHGIDIDPTDASPELAAEAETRIGRKVRILHFSELDARDAYNGVWACASLLHAPAAELADDLARIYRALKPGGIFVASFKAGNGEGRDGLGRYYNYPDRTTLQAHYRGAADWQALSIEAVMGSGYDNLPTEWLWATAQR